MKMVKSLLLGSAAGLVAIAGAQAADLPVKAKPVEYVKVCSLYGVGFFYIPGTDTCLKIGGYVRGEVNINSGGSFTPYQSGANARDNREVTDTTMRARFLISTDTRTQTEYGTLRSYTRTGWTTTTGAPADINIGSTASIPTSLAVYIDRAFIQFAGFTAGRAQSFFDSYILGVHSNQTNIIGSENAGNGTHMFAYTAQLGNGLSATLSVEDGTWRRKPLVDLSAGPLIPVALGAAASDYAGHRIPDIVGNIRLDQAWGYAQVSGAAHEMRALYYTGPIVGAPASCTGVTTGANVETCGSPSNEWGWAFNAGFVLNLPFAKGDTMGASFGWTEGALNYVAGNQSNQFTVYSGLSSVGLGALTDGVYVNGGDISKTEAWSVIAGIEHYWTPSLRSSLYGGYISVEYDAAARTAICATPIVTFGATASAGAGYVCDPDFKFWQIGTRTVWNPVLNLDLSFDVIYNKLETAFGGSVVLPAAGSKPAGTYAIDDQDWWQFMFRVQRNFWL